MRGPQRALAQLVAEVLDPDADERRERAVRGAGGDFDGGRFGVPVLFRVRPVAVAVLEIQPEVLDRLALQLLRHPRVDARRGGRREAEHRAERVRIRGVFVRAPAAPSRRGAPRCPP